jgi:hypothetical protein
MVAVPVKPQYGPTLGRILAPRWHRASPLVRGLCIAAGVGLVVVLVAAVLTLENAKFSHGGRVPFSFSYRGLSRVTPAPGQFVKVQQRSAGGRLEASFAVGPLLLPSYAGELSAELPLFASGYIRGLSHRYRDFQLRGEGKGTVNSVPSYSVYYSARVEGRTMYGRDVLLLPERSGAREGLDIMMLVVPSSTDRSPLEVASGGVLSRPLKTLTLG